jgi:hypothetical protein
MDELLNSNLLRTFQKDMCTVYICVCEGVRVTEAQVDMRLCCEVEDCINFVSFQTVHDL